MSSTMSEALIDVMKKEFETYIIPKGWETRNRKFR